MIGEEVVPDSADLSFRPMIAADLPRLHAWLHQPHVFKWWKEAFSLEEVVLKYAERINGTNPTLPFLILLGHREIGYIQVYLIDDHPDYAAALGLEEPAIGVDLFIGEPDLIHRGLGAPLLRRFLAEIGFPRWPEAPACVIGPDVANAAAIRAYRRAGFRPLKTVLVPGEDAPEFLLRLPREQLGT